METSGTAETCYRHAGTKAGVRCQRCERLICPSCMRAASVGFQCPECVSRDTQRVYRAADLEPNPVVTKVLVAVNVAVFLYAMVQDGNGMFSFNYGLLGDGVAAGEWWRLVTGGFLHANLMHIGFNMFILWQIGHQLENWVGPVRFSLAYLASVLAGALGVLVLDPHQLTVGASGGVYGLFGVLLVAQLSKGVNPFDTGLGGIIGLNLILTFVIPRISIGGHIGGLLGGMVAGAAIYLVSPRLGSRPDNRGVGDQTSMALLGALCLAIAAASLWMAGRGGLL